MHSIESPSQISENKHENSSLEESLAQLAEAPPGFALRVIAKGENKYQSVLVITKYKN